MLHVYRVDTMRTVIKVLTRRAVWILFSPLSGENEIKLTWRPLRLCGEYNI